MFGERGGEEGGLAVDVGGDGELVVLVVGGAVDGGDGRGHDPFVRGGGFGGVEGFVLEEVVGRGEEVVQVDEGLPPF